MFALVYEELRRLAAAKLLGEHPGHTLSATALVHEAYLRLADGARASIFADRQQFLFVAAEAMRRILVDHARKKRAGKRGGGARQFQVTDADRFEIPDPDTLLTIDETIERLQRQDAAVANIARLRLFAGLSVEEAGAALGMSRATAFREWSFAKAVLGAALTGDPQDPSMPSRQ